MIKGIDWKDWYSVAGCESAFLAFDPDDPQVIFGGCYQGIIDRWYRATQLSKEIKEYPELVTGECSLGISSTDTTGMHRSSAHLMTDLPSIMQEM